jgi:hypothetical protein
MKKIIYSRYGNDRGEQFRIRTDVLQDEKGRKYVHKTALTKAAEAHIDNVYRDGKLLEEQYEGTKFYVNKCEKIDERTLEFEFLKGKNLESLLDEYLYHNNLPEFLAIIHEYKEQMEQLAVAKFHNSDGFRKIFGELLPAEGQAALPITDIDQIFQNIIVDGEKWYVYDYEWTVPFAVPLKYVFYRCALFYGEFERKSFLEGKVNLMTYFQITEKEKRLFQKMEERMQAYILSGHTPLWDIYSLINPKNYYPIGMVMEAGIKAADALVTIRKNYQDGRCEETMIAPTPNTAGKYVFEIPVSGDLDILQIVPAQGPCMAVVHMMNLRGDGAEEKDYMTNGIDMGNGMVCYPAGNAGIWMRHFASCYHTLHVEMTVSVMDNAILTACSNYILKTSKQIAAQQQEGARKQEDIVKLLEENARVGKENESLISTQLSLTQQIEELHKENERLAAATAQSQNDYASIANSLCWKITKPVRVVLDKVKGR